MKIFEFMQQKESFEWYINLSISLESIESPAIAIADLNGF